MNNYTIDASVYAYSLNINSSQKEINNFLKNVNNLYKIVMGKQPRNIRCYLLLKDIKLLKILNLDITKLRANSLPRTLRNAQRNLFFMYKKLLPGTVSNNLTSNRKELSRYYLFEENFGIDSINFHSQPQFSYDISQEINKNLQDNFKKNIAIIVALNNFVYKNCETHKIIYGNNTALNDVSISTDFSITMKQSSFVDNKSGKTYYYTHRIKNFPSANSSRKERINIKMQNQNAKFSTLDTLVKNEYNYQLWACWEDAFCAAQTQFSNIEFGPECRDGIEQYANKIELEKRKIPNQKDLNKIDQWKEQFPCVLYENLKALHTCMGVMNKARTLNINERYDNNCRKCSTYALCGSHIRLFGPDCVEETLNMKKNSDVQKDRSRKNSLGCRSDFWQHLRVYSKACDDPLSFLTLRLYFRWITDRKIQIGWIGRHLYLPCKSYDERTNSVPNCGRPFDCPLNPLCEDHDPKKDKLTNYLKQWP